MSFEEDESYLFGESSEGEGGEESSSSTAKTSESFPAEALEVSVELADLWNSVLEGKISIEEFKQTLAALQSTVDVGRRRRRRRKG
ncbi:MAG: hypothetical protein GXO07_03480 [Crenarchaeota archaeon]|nr:hypothetical protein [Thermoproteota archaeon]